MEIFFKPQKKPLTLQKGTPIGTVAHHTQSERQVFYFSLVQEPLRLLESRSLIWNQVSKLSVVDRPRFDADPDPNFRVDADQDPDPTQSSIQYMLENSEFFYF